MKMEVWKEYTIEDVLELLIDYRGKTPKKSETGIPTLSAKSVKMNHIDYSQCYYISREEYDRFMIRGFPKKGDILLTTEAPLGMVARLDRDDIALGQRLITLRGKKDVLDNGYLLYYFQSPAGQYNLKSRETGTTVTGIKQSEFRKLRIPIPPLPTQQKIAAILSSLDDKIELNNKINTNLEQQAGALFKNWFVDFEPFGGKMPEGWQVGKLSDIAEIKTDTFKPEQNPDIQVEHYSLPAFDEKRYPTFEISKELKSNKFIISNDEVLVSKLNPTVKRVWRPYCLTEKSICSTEFIVYKPISAELKNYLFSIVNSSEFNDFMCSNVTGSTNSHQRTPPKTTLNYEIPIPTKDILHKFCNIVTPMYDKIKENIKQNETVSSLRDTLLPKLMNGEIEV